MRHSGVAYGDNDVWLNGTDMKRGLKEDAQFHISSREEMWKGIVAHELTHTMQNRLATLEREAAKASGTFVGGTEYAENLSKRILDTAIDRYIANEENALTRDAIYKVLKATYGRNLENDKKYYVNSERMAVVLQRTYEHKLTQRKDNIAVLGKYVAEELKKMM